jgi:hypothetical protein
MQEHERSLWTLLIIGASIAVGKLLASPERLTLRLIIGRALLGSATSMIAGVALIQVPDISPLALCGIGCALGIVGAQYLELWFKKRADQVFKGDGK